MLGGRRGLTWQELLRERINYTLLPSPVRRRLLRAASDQHVFRNELRNLADEDLINSRQVQELELAMVELLLAENPNAELPQPVFEEVEPDDLNQAFVDLDTTMNTTDTIDDDDTPPNSPRPGSPDLSPIQPPQRRRRTGAGRSRPRRFDTSPVAFNMSPNPRMNTRRRALTPQQLRLVVMPYTPDNPTVPRPGSIPRGHRFKSAIDEEEMVEFDRIAERAGLEDMQPYTTRNRDEVVEAARQAVAEISDEGRLHDQTGPNKENIESNFTEAIEKMKEIIPQWKKKMQKKAVIEVLGKLLLQ